ncbi:MAG: CsbD family protein [Bacteriovoracaceae bacterium]|nr:CsbD family protein [Bacteriovoracaceae bacterium]
MALNQNTVEGKWLEIRGDLQKAWGKLTDSELDKTKGDIRAISGLIQQKYGEAQDTYRKKVTEIIAKFETKKDEAVSGLKASMKK